MPDEQACCAHLRVEYRSERVEEDVPAYPSRGAYVGHAGGPMMVTRGWWECAHGCGARFAVIPRPVSAPAASGTPKEQTATDEDRTEKSVASLLNQQQEPEPKEEGPMRRERTRHYGSPDELSCINIDAMTVTRASLIAQGVKPEAADELIAYADRLLARGALAKFARHADDCAWRRNDPAGCDCGLAKVESTLDARAALPVPPSVEPPRPTKWDQPLAELQETAAQIQRAIDRLTPPAAAPSGEPSDQWVVWSTEHDAWWGPNRGGYTSSLMQAGLYTEAEARRIERLRSPVGERAIPVAEALASEAAAARTGPKVSDLFALRASARSIREAAEADTNVRRIYGPLMFALLAFLDAEAPAMLALEKADPDRFARWHGLANLTRQTATALRSLPPSAQ